MSDPVCPDGLALAHTLWGEPDTSVTHAWTASGAGGVELVPAGITGTPYLGDPRYELVPQTESVAEGVRDPRKCMANDNTCEGWRMTDSKYCSGHRRYDVSHVDFDDVNLDGEDGQVR